MTLVIASLLGLISLALVAYLVRFLLGASFGDLRSLLEGMAFKKAARQLNELENQVARGELEGLPQKLRGIFYLEASLNSPSLVDTVVTHNLTALSVLISVSQKRSLRLDGIPIVEELFQMRGELLKNHHNTKASLKRAATSSGKGGTNWAADELRSKGQDIKRALATNRESLAKEIEKILAAFEKSSDTSITLH